MENIPKRKGIFGCSSLVPGDSHAEAGQRTAKRLFRGAENRADDDAGGTLVARCVILRRTAGFEQKFGIVAQGNEPRPQLLVGIHRPGRTQRDQVAGLLELGVVGAEGHGQAERGRLERVMDATPNPPPI